MATKTQFAIAAVINSIFVLSLPGCSTVRPPLNTSPPFIIHTRAGKDCVPVNLRDLARRCLYDADRDSSDLQRRDLARQLVRSKNPTNGTPPWCLPPQTVHWRTEQCSDGWRIPVLKTWDVPEQDWGNSDIGPPIPDTAASPEANAACRGFMECQRSFTAHHPIVAQSMGAVAIAFVGWALVRLIAGHGHGHEKPNGQVCVVASGTCPPAPSPPQNCGDWYLLPPAQQALTMKPVGC